MQKLLEGIHHFQANAFRSSRALFRRLEDGQNPLAIFITCSDSRINPNLITHTGPGDLFIIRNAGNIVPPYGTGTGGEAASIEYGISALGIRDIIVCGHSHCGAMGALLDCRQVEHLPAVKHWLSLAESTRRVMQENYSHLKDVPLQTATAEENVLSQLENLRTHPAVAAGLRRGELKLHGWMYKFETGEVFAYDPEKGQFHSLSFTGPECDHEPQPVAAIDASARHDLLAESA